MPLILGTNSIKDTGYNVANSCRFDGTSAYLYKSTSSGTNTKFTYSVWIKRSSSDASTAGTQYPRILGSHTNSGAYLRLNFNRATDGEQLHLYSETVGGASTLLTNRFFRDPTAWMHILVAVDTTDGTADDRQKIFINGVQETSFATRSNPSQNADYRINNGSSTLTVGKKSFPSEASDFFDGYMAEVHYIDGTAYAPTDFGEYDSDSPTIWKPKEVSGINYGTNGFYLDFADSSNLGNDANGGTDLTEVNLATTDQSTDTCTNNFATWNPLFRKGTSTPAFAEGNLKSTFDDSGANEFALTTFGVDTGKWYAEVKWTSAHGNSATATGILDMDYTGTADPNNAVTNAFGYFGNGNKNVSGTASSYGASYTSGDIIGIALNCDDNQVTFYKNGSSQGVISIIAGVTYGIFASDYGSKVAELNTGSPPYAISSGNSDGNGYGNFEYSVPSGYYSLNSKNLAEFG